MKYVRFWTKHDDETMLLMLRQGEHLAVIAEHLNRSQAAVGSRMDRLRDDMSARAWRVVLKDRKANYVKRRNELAEQARLKQEAGDGPYTPLRRVLVKPKAATVMNHAASFFGVRKEDLIGPRRTRGIARPRQVVMYLTRSACHKSFPEIGKMLGGRDHTTAIHGVIAVERRLASDPNLGAELAPLISAVMPVETWDTRALPVHPDGKRGYIGEPPPFVFHPLEAVG